MFTVNKGEITCLNEYVTKITPMETKTDNMLHLILEVDNLNMSSSPNRSFNSLAKQEERDSTPFYLKDLFLL